MKVKDYMLIKRLRLMALLKGKTLKHLTDGEILEKISMARLRNHFTSLGYDFSNMTDDELSNRISNATKLLAKNMFSHRDVAEGINRAVNKK